MNQDSILNLRPRHVSCDHWPRRTTSGDWAPCSNYMMASSSRLHVLWLRLALRQLPIYFWCPRAGRLASRGAHGFAIAARQKPWGPEGVPVPLEATWRKVPGSQEYIKYRPNASNPGAPSMQIMPTLEPKVYEYHQTLGYLEPQRKFLAAA